jgi:hypothetical protein
MTQDTPDEQLFEILLFLSANNSEIDSECVALLETLNPPMTNCSSGLSSIMLLPLPNGCEPILSGIEDDS